MLTCLTTALAGSSEGLEMLDLPESKVRELGAEAGFSSVRRLPVEHPLHVLYALQP